MSSIELSSYLQHRMKELHLSNTEVARRANISRQTWHRLLKNNIIESKISTLMGVSKALDTHFIYLLRLHFNHQESSDPAAKKPMLLAAKRGLKNELSMQNEKIFKIGESFIKIWRVVNLGQKNWQGMKLICLDPDTRSTTHPNGLCLIATQKEVLIPNTKIGKPAEISVQLTTPDCPGRIISAWQIVDKDGKAYTGHGGILQCVVHVISI
jgi:transcriptional regulator with XRE-family HTH domain